MKQTRNEHWVKVQKARVSQFNLAEDKTKKLSVWAEKKPGSQRI